VLAGGAGRDRRAPVQPFEAVAAFGKLLIEGGYTI
jgi:hypothetical protein